MPERPLKRRTLSKGEKARLLLRKARHQLEIAKKGVESGSDDVAVTFLFQACENSVRAATKSTGAFADTKAHWDLESQAADLADQGYLGSDISECPQDLSAGRKQAAYGYEEHFEHSDFEEVIEELESFMQEVEALIARDGKKLKEG
jgi:HEPN domain-containing protein